MTQLWEHLDYKARKAAWGKYRDLYQGDHDVVCAEPYLIKHRLESIQGNKDSAALWTSRAQRTRYLNLNEILVSIWVSIFFKDCPKLDEEAQALLDQDGATQDIDGYGLSLNSFVQNVAECRINYGKAAILVDSPNIQVLSRADEIAKGRRPFMELIEPLDLPDWDVETLDPKRRGRFNFARREYLYYPPRTRASEQPKVQRRCDEYFIEGNGIQVNRFYIDLDPNRPELGRDKLVSQADWKLDTTQPLGIDEIPIAYLDRDSWLKDASEEALRYHNLRSNYDNVLYFQGYDTKVATGVDINDNESLKGMTEYTVVCLKDPEAAITKIDANDGAGLERACIEALNTTFKIGLNMLRQLPSDSRAVQGEGTQQEEKDNQYAIVESSLSEQETLLQYALDLYAKFKGVDNFKGKICLNKEIREEDIDAFNRLVLSARDSLMKVEGFEKAYVKKLIGHMGFDEEDQAALIKAADKVPATRPEPQQPGAMGQRLIGQARGSNGQQQSAS